MTVVEAVELIVALALLATSYYLSEKAAKKTNNGDVVPTTLSNRGDYAPLVIGTRRIGYLFCFSWARKSKNVSGGKGGGGSGAAGKTWRESAWHVLCPGVGTEILSIFANGKRIWKTTISRETSPSGTGFTLADYGVFYVFWGEADQPIHADLAAHLGVNSRHPGMFHIVWVDFFCGSSPTWPQIEYVVRVECQAIALAGSDYIITNGDGRGVNLAHALAQVLCAPFPSGGGIAPADIDNDTMEALGVLMQSEGIGANLVMGDGMATQQAVGNLIQDAGAMMPQIQGRLAFIPNRLVTDPVPILSDDIKLPPDFERDINQGDDDVTRTIFTFKNEQAFAYNDTDIIFTDDGEVSDIGRVTNAQVPIFSTTSFVMTNPIARRRSQESAIAASFKVTVNHGLGRLYPGQKFDDPTYGRLVVVTVLPSDQKPDVELEVVQDIYSVPDTSDVGDPGGGGGSDLDPLDDLGINFFQLPEGIATLAVPQIVVFRTRAHDQMEGATVLASVDGSTFAVIGNQDTAAAGGLIQSAIAAGDASPIVAGPLFEDSNGDAATDVMDYTGDSVSWGGGAQLAVIDDEVFFLESITVEAETQWAPSTAYLVGQYVIPTGSTGFRYRCITAGTTHSAEPLWSITAGVTVADNTVVWEARYYLYRLNNLIRAQYGTTAADHAIGARVFIAQHTDLVPLTSVLFTSGADVTIKTNPFSRNGIATTGPEVTKTLT